VVVKRRLPGGATGSAAAWVAAVDRRGGLLLDSHCRPDLPPGARCIGGVRPEDYAAAPPAGRVAEQVAQLLRGRLLVGHGLAKDLAALGLGGAPGLCQYDTMAFPPFQNAAGNARSLAALAAQHLQVRQLQAPGRPHDPRVDAAAAMRLYVLLVEPARLTYEQTVAVMTAQMLAAAGTADRAGE